MFNAAYVMRILLWFAYALYVACFVPQVMTNHRVKSTKGLSNTTICIYFFGYLIEILYAFLLGLPLALRVMIPLGAGVAGTLVGQRIYYETNKWHRLRAIVLYVSLSCFAVAMALWGISQPLLVGHLCGWIGSMCWFIYQLPQFYKVYKTKSVEGFNYALIIIASIGAVIEIAAAVIIPLPPQALFNGMRGLLGALLFTYQFNLYHKGSWHEWIK